VKTCGFLRGRHGARNVVPRKAADFGGGDDAKQKILWDFQPFGGGAADAGFQSRGRKAPRESPEVGDAFCGFRRLLQDMGFAAERRIR